MERYGQGTKPKTRDLAAQREAKGYLGQKKQGCSAGGSQVERRPGRRNRIAIIKQKDKRSSQGSSERAWRCGTSTSFRRDAGA